MQVIYLLIILILFFIPGYRKHLQSAEIPVPHIKKENIPVPQLGVSIVPPKDPSEHHRHQSPAFFELDQIKQQLVLQFKTTDPFLQLDKEKIFVVELLPDPPIQLNPSIITPKNWLKNGNQLHISVQNAVPGSVHRILGHSYYTYCHSKTHHCTSNKIDFTYYYRPPKMIPNLNKR